MKLLGKALIANKKTTEGKNVIMLVGSFDAQEAPELEKMLGDEFNIALMEIHVKDIAASVPLDDSSIGSPEEFFVRCENFDWQKVVKEGKRIQAE